MSAVPVPGTPWRTLAPFPAPTWEMEGVECGGRLYLIGGITNDYGAKSGWIPDRHNFAYDPTSDAWQRRAPIPRGIHHMSLAECDGAIYGFGGYRTPDSGPDAWQTVASAWRYDPGADRWSELAPLPFARGAASAATLGGRIYLAGGSYLVARPGETDPAPSAPHMSVGQVLEYDPAADRYREVAPLLTARNHHVLEAAGGRLYAIGGRVGASNIAFANKIDLVEAYEPRHDAWTPLSRMPVVHSSVVASVHAGAIFLAGGEGVDSVDRYDPAEDRWSTVGRLPVPRLGAAGGCLNGRLHVIAGHVRTATGSRPVGEHLALDL